MSLLDDPTLRLRAAPRPEFKAGGTRARFLPGSVYAREMGIPDEAVGEVLDHHKRDGVIFLTLRINGVGVATGVPAGEVVER